MTTATQPTLLDAPTQARPIFIVAESTCGCCTAYFDADELRRMWTNLGGGSWRECCQNCGIMFEKLRRNRDEAKH
jgi:hypothetical protein